MKGPSLRKKLARLSNGYYNLSVERDEFEKKQKDFEVIAMHILQAIRNAKTRRMRR